jgi:hypothetical protein
VTESAFHRGYCAKQEDVVELLPPAQHVKPPAAIEAEIHIERRNSSRAHFNIESLGTKSGSGITCQSHSPDRITNGSGEKIPEMQVGEEKSPFPTQTGR